MTFDDRVRDILAVKPPPIGWAPPHDARVEQGDPVEWEASVAPIQANLIRCLSDIEWVDFDDPLSDDAGRQRCPWCCSFKTGGHHPECVLGALLTRARGKRKPVANARGGAA